MTIELPNAEWQACVKLPVTVHVRTQREGETHVSTREGITPIKPDDLIMRGVQGEEYPIGREIFERTYRMGEAFPPKPDTEELEAQREAFIDACNANAKLHDQLTRYRAVMEQAKEALEWSVGGEPIPTKEIEALTALREALKEE